MPSSRSSCAAASSLSGRRAEMVSRSRPRPAPGRSRGPIPLDPPVMSAARVHMARALYFELRLRLPRRRELRPSSHPWQPALLVCAVLVAGCGGDDSTSGDQQAPPAGAGQGLPEARTASRSRSCWHRPPGMAPCSRHRASSSAPGKHRFGFALFSPLAQADHGRERRRSTSRRRAAGRRAGRTWRATSRWRSSRSSRAADGVGPRRGQVDLRRRDPVRQARAATTCSAWRSIGEKLVAGHAPSAGSRW